MAQLSDVTVDSTGRVHTVAVADFGIGKTIWYEMRANASAGFAESGERTLVKFTTAGRAPRSVSIGVTDEFTAQIAMVDETGRLFVYELPRSADSWEETNLGDNGWGDPRTGVSIESRGDGGFTRSMIAYTQRADSGTNSDGVALLEQRDDGSWTAQGNAVTGAGTGMAPRLINMDTTARLPETRRVVVYYNDSSKQVESVRAVRENGAGLFFWYPPIAVTTTASPAFTRPGGDALGQTVGVSFVPSSSAGVTYAELVPNLFTDDPDDVRWIGSKITTVDEDPAESDDFGGFAAQTGVAMDAAGNPWVAYSRITRGFAEDIRARRNVPNVGWEVSVVENFDNSIRGISDSLAIATGANGDPSLVYERSRGAISDLVFARPFTAPWVVEKPEAFDDVRQSFAPAMANNPDGSFHLVTSHSVGGGDIFHPKHSNDPSQVHRPEAAYLLGQTR